MPLHYTVLPSHYTSHSPKPPLPLPIFILLLSLTSQPFTWISAPHCHSDSSPWVWTNTIKLHKPTQLSHLIFQHCHFNPRNTLRYYCHNNIACFITFSNYTNIFLEYPDILNLFAWLMMFKWETGLWGQPKIILPPTVFFLFHLKYFLWCSG